MTPAEAPARTAAALDVAGVAKRFGPATALHDVSLAFEAGGLTTLLGPSGCGKTTLLRVIAGFLAADAGQVRISGRDVAGEPPWRRRIGFVFQSYALWPHMTVAGNIAYGLRLRRLDRERTGARVADVLARVGMEGMGGRQPGQLSGGQQQRVALARALVLEPELLLLDEPLSNLDARLRVEMRREVRRLQREVGITTVYVTHDQEEALAISDRIAVMNQGRIEQAGPAEELYRRPRTRFVATFLGAATLLQGRACGDGQLELGSGRRLPLGLAPALAGRHIEVALRPEDVAVERSGAGGAIPASVVEETYLGHAFKLVARAADGLELTAYAPEAAGAGGRVWLKPARGAVIAGDEGGAR